VSAFIDEHRERFGLGPVCRTLGVSASAYYQRATGERCERAVEDQRLVEVIRATHAANYYAYAYRRTWKALGRAGHDVGRDRVKRLMRRAGIQGAKRRGNPWRTTVPDRARCGRPIWSSATSAPAGRMSCGWRTSPACAAGRAWSSSAWSSTPTAAASWAGSSPTTCAPTSSSTRCAWP